MKVVATGLLLIALGCPAIAKAGDLDGPGRFCSYSTIIELDVGERVTTLSGGIHGGTFSWSGDFGTLLVTNIGWASRPLGDALNHPTSAGETIFSEREVDGRFTVAIWNGRNGAAYFASDAPLTVAQFSVIDRVNLFDELDDAPSGCDLRTVFSWQ